MPRYALEIHEPDGKITEGEHTSPEGEWWTEGHEFEHEGRRLHVRRLKEAHGPFEQILVCVPI